MNYKFGCIYDTDFSFGIDGPKVVLIVPLDSLDFFSGFLKKPNDLFMFKEFHSYFKGLDSFHYQIGCSNSLCINGSAVELQLNKKGLLKILEEIQGLSKQGSFTYLDFDEEFDAAPWVECILSTSMDLYKSLSDKESNGDTQLAK